jgi:hypothetical protein
MKTSPMIDPKVLQPDVLGLFTNGTVHGLTIEEVTSVLAGRERYAKYPKDYIREWVESMTAKLCGQGLIVGKADRYFPAEPAAAD